MTTAAAAEDRPDPNNREVSDLTFEQVQEEFAKAGASEPLVIRETDATELRRQLEDAIGRGQFVYKVTHSDGGHAAQVMTNLGLMTVAVNVSGSVSMSQPQLRLNKGTFDAGAKIIEAQEKYKAEGSTVLETGAQFGRWYL